MKFKTSKEIYKQIKADIEKKFYSYKINPSKRSELLKELKAASKSNLSIVFYLLHSHYICFFYLFQEFYMEFLWITIFAFSNPSFTYE